MLLAMTILGWTFACAALCGAVYAVMAAALAARFMKPKTLPVVPVGPVTLLKPLHFDGAGLRETLESYFNQNYAAPVQIVFGVHDAADPAVAVVKALQAKYPHTDTSLVIDSSLHGANGKISNLVNMLPAARHDVLVLSDSDISVGPNWLATVTAALDQPGIGVVTCLYTGQTPPGPKRARFWSMLAAMGTSYEFLPNVLFGISFGLAAPCFGSTIAIRRAVLDEIGGFRAFSGTLADDYEIGRAARARGYGVAIPAIGVTHTAHEDSAETLWQHELRWTRTIRTINRLGHLGAAVTLAVPLALIGTIFLDFNLASLGVLALALAARLLLKTRIDAIFGVPAGPLWWLPLRDLFSFAVFVASLSGETVHWRGTRFEVQADGAISPF